VKVRHEANAYDDYATSSFGGYPYNGGGDVAPKPLRRVRVSPNVSVNPVGLASVGVVSSNQGLCGVKPLGR